MFRQINPYFRIFLINKRKFHTHNRLSDIYERPRSNYPLVYDEPPLAQNLSYPEKLKLAYRLFKDDCKTFAKEIRSKFRLYPELVLPGEEDTLLKFDGTEKSLKQWVVNYDSVYNEGFSTAKLELSPTGTGVFHGILNVTVPQDGRTKRSGYCNITTMPKTKSFNRKDYYNLYGYTELILKVRGDGRCYMVNLLHKGYIDMTWYHCYSYVMYTRGGPYWQEVRIPFSKFVFSEKGSVQDRQHEMPTPYVTNIGITLADKKPGPFRLEIDYIAVCRDMFDSESCAYEMEDMSKQST